MTSVSHEPMTQRRDGPRWAEFLRVREVWASLAISMMWLAVAVAAVWGPDFVSTNGPGAQSTTIPSAIFVALFAWLASASMARHVLRRDD
jgi:hypothetical protein